MFYFAYFLLHFKFVVHVRQTQEKPEAHAMLGNSKKNNFLIKQLKKIDGPGLKRVLRSEIICASFLSTRNACVTCV